jgi:hypothetical protein
MFQFRHNNLGEMVNSQRKVHVHQRVGVKLIVNVKTIAASDGVDQRGSFGNLKLEDFLP